MPKNSSLFKPGSKRGNNSERIAAIQRDRQDGKTQAEIARKYGISQQAISKLLKRLAASEAPSHSSSHDPRKPRPDYPLTPHEGSGQWCKRINGDLYYFGKLNDPDTALRRFCDERDDLYAGRQPRSRREDATIRDVCNAFLADRKERLASGDITQRTFDDYHGSCQALIDHFGAGQFVVDLVPLDFAEFRAELAARLGAVALGNEIGRIRCVFNHAFDIAEIERPVRWAKSFQKPSRAQLRKHRNGRPKKFLTADSIQDILEVCSTQMRAMVLLGVNAGLGNADCALLTWDRIKGEWIDYPRHKTGVQRSCWLWPETVVALEAARKERPSPKNSNDEHLVFITKYGSPWTGKDRSCPISQQFRKAAIAAGCYVPGVGFYSLRHVCETIGGESKDQVAVNHIMGHVDESQGEVCRENIGDDRIKSVSMVIRQWLFGDDRAARR
jgi:integrase/transposase-like protein